MYIYITTCQLSEINELSSWHKTSNGCDGGRPGGWQGAASAEQDASKVVLVVQGARAEPTVQETKGALAIQETKGAPAVQRAMVVQVAQGHRKDRPLCPPPPMG